MKTRLLPLIALCAFLPLCVFGQAGENLPGFREIYAVATTPSNGTSCIQALTFGATITSGTFKLRFEGKNTAAITWSATDATLVANIDAALEALPNIGTGGVTTAQGTISSGVNGTVTVTFTGNRAKQPVAVMSVPDNSLVGAAHTLTAAITTAGVDADGRILPKGALLVNLATGGLYTNTGSPPNPTWTLVTSAVITVPSAAVADLGAVTVGTALGAFTDPPSDTEMAALRTFVNALKTDAAADRAKINDLLAKLRTAGIVTP